MVTRVRTIDFLPEIFKTNTNKQFLSATVDQLVQQPNHTKLQGFVGSKFGYGIDAKDKYVYESSKVRNDYQLEPAVIFKKKDSALPLDALTYPGIVDALALESGVKTNHNSLFSNEFYSWDSFVELDKLINYSQYYWVPGDLEAVNVSTSTLFYNLDFTVSGVNTYNLTSTDIALDSENPTLTLVRGGTYNFFVNQDSNFWIQTMPGVSGTDPTKSNVNTRDVLGVSNNGASVGTVTFTVPLSSAQDEYSVYGQTSVDLVTTLTFEQVNGRPFNELKNIDGVTGIDGKTIMFYGTKPGTIATVTEFFDSSEFDSTAYEKGIDTSVTSNIYKIRLIGDPNNPVISLSEYQPIENDTKILVRFGDEYITRNFSRNSDGEIILLPLVTAKLDTLYYQDGTLDTKFGKILLVDQPTDDFINVNNILGAKNYISPNGIQFSNGLKVRFLGSVYPEEYLHKEFFVEGVGTAITLVDVADCVLPEPFSQSFASPYESQPYDISPFDGTLMQPYAQDYLTINRGSLSKNAWSRSNRWFHVDVLKTIIANNTTSPIASAALEGDSARAKRPIIEFYPNLKLFNSGVVGKKAVDFIDTTETDALANISGKKVYHPDGNTTSLFNGARIIFANDKNPAVRNKIYVANITSLSEGADPTISLSVAFDGMVEYNHQTVVLRGDKYIGQSFYFDGANWVQAQFKNRVNQPPLFDLFDNNGISLGDKAYYPGSDFTGCSLFQYSVGTGNDDPILMFPIKYSGVNNLGDISFDVTINSQTFNYVYNSVSINEPVRSGYVYDYNSVSNYTRRISWQTAVEPSFQYQVFNYEYNSTMASPTFICDVKVKDSTTTKWPTLSVYLNNERVDATNYTVSTTAHRTIITLNSAPADGTPVEVLVYSDQMSSIGYYQIPSNFDHNPFNEEVTVVNMGDLKGHYKSMLNNAPGVSGAAFGPNNYRDLGNLVPYGTRIIQSSAPMGPAAAFIRNKNANFFDSMQYNSNEYAKFKATMIDTVNRGDYDAYQTAANILDDVMDQMSETKTEASPFFWSDMVPTKNPLITKTYTFKNKLDTSVYPLSRVYDFKNANYYSVLVYITRIVNGFPKVTQLVRDYDYFISATDKNITVTFDLVAGDTLTIKEYDQTYGNFVPNTPTKLGFYPAFLPEVVLDETYITPTYFLKGHDGSYTRLYGDYINNELIDFRDRVLFEFEMRVYNNLKSSAKIPLTYEDVFPGQYRTTDYTFEEIQTIYSTYFLNWVGLNRLEYTPQYFDAANEYTWNYSNSVSKADGNKFSQGSWRGIYLWLYDTVNPATRPWEILGLQNKPSWWDSHYGEAPYTSENKVLWEDISNGFVWNNGDSYIDEKRVRPNMIIPVDNQGRSVGPFVGVVASYDYGKFQQEWKIGDVGPTEFAYLRSSAFPFDLMRIFAVTKPAKFFTLGMDLDVYQYSSEFKQYLVYDRIRTTPKDIVVYGTDDTAASHSYFNWVVDYLQQYGIDGSSTVLDLIQSLDVRLAYRLAGFSDKNMLNFYVEKGSPNSKNTSLLIPDESYSVLLYENQPNDTITYSSIIVQRTEKGFKVYGTSQNKAYFAVATALINGNYDTITVGNSKVVVPKNYKTTSTLLPYGTEFASVQEVSNFIKAYGEHLVQQGMIFDDMENGLTLDWNQMIAEFMYWVQSGWDVGSIVNINPCANAVSIDKASSIVQPLTMHKDNFVLNQNLIPIQNKDMAINRDGTKFTAKTLNKGDSISLFKANLSTIEHLVVFDNYTVFDDVLFNLTTGLRQQRLYVKGSKTAAWDGTLNAAGFILNQDNVEEWKPNVSYSKGVIVQYKRDFWIANRVSIAPSNTFDPTQWVKTNYEEIQKGLLPNPSTRAFESLLYYDIDRANLETDGDILGYSLIGYRPRTYLSDGNLDDTTQVNVYQKMIEGKGTKETLSMLQGVTLQQNTLNYTFNENWAIKTGEFGGILSQNFVEFTLDESLLTGNPSTVELSSTIPTDGVEQTVFLNNIKNYGRSVESENILPIVTDGIDQLPSAGYVHLDDVRYTGYKFANLDNTTITYLYKNDYIWVADKDGSWDVYTPISMEKYVTNVFNNLNDTITLVFNKPHGLVEKDPFGVIGFNNRIDGYYVVESIIDTRSLIVSLTLPKAISTLTGTGIAFKLQSQRISSAEGLLDLPLLNSNYVKNRVWVDKDGNGNWEVLNKVNAYTNKNFTAGTFGHKAFGSQVAYIPKLGFFITDPENGKMYQYREAGAGIVLARTWTESISFGSSLSYNDNYLVVAAPHIPLGSNQFSSMIYVYRIVKEGQIETLVEEERIPIAVGFDVGTAVEISGDGNYLYATIPSANSVMVFKRDTQPTYYPIVYQEGTTTIIVNGQTYIIPKDKYVVLNQATVYGERQFVVRGDQTGRIPSAKRVVFTSLARNPVGTLYETLINNNNYLKINGNVTSTLVAGDKIAFTDHEIYTVLATSFVPSSNYTSVQIAQPIAEVSVIPANTAVNKMYISTPLTIVTGKFDPATNTTTFFTSEPIPYTMPSGYKVCTVSDAFTIIRDYLSVPFTQVGDEFGFSIATNYDSTKVFIGAPKADFARGVANAGYVYCFDRLVESWEVQYDIKPTDFYVGIMPFAPDEKPDGTQMTVRSTVYIDGVKVDPSFYRIVHNLIITGPLKAGTIVTVSSNRYVITQQAANYESIYDVKPGSEFGYAIDCNTTGSELIVSAPSLIDNATNSEGVVYRFTHEGKKYGRITGLIQTNLFDPTYILLNGYSVPINPEIIPATRITAGYNGYTITSLGTTDWVALGAQTAGDMVASIDGTNLIVTQHTFGKLLTTSQVTGGNQIPGTIIDTQLTSDVVNAVSKTISSIPGVSLAYLTVDTTDLVANMHVTGDNIPSGTLISLVDHNAGVIVLTKPLTATVNDETVVFYGDNAFYMDNGSAVFDYAHKTPGASGTRKILFDDVSGLIPRQFSPITGLSFYQLVTGTGIPGNYMYVESINGNEVTLNSVDYNANTQRWYEENKEGQPLVTYLHADAAGTYTITDKYVAVSEDGTHYEVTSGSVMYKKVAGAQGSSSLPMATTSGIKVGHLVVGTGVPTGTYVAQISGNVLKLAFTNGTDTSLTADTTGNYNFKQTHSVGTYKVSEFQVKSSQSLSVVAIGTPFTAREDAVGNGTGTARESANAYVVANQINLAAITNVFAYATEDGRLVIRLRDFNLNQANNKLSISEFNGNYLYQLGISEYIKTQAIVDPRKQQRSRFGHTIKFNQYNSFAIGAPTSDRHVGTLFDFSDDENTHNDTVFDNNLTQFEDSFNDSGAVYVYDYVQSYNEGLANPGQYVFSQTCNDNNLDVGANAQYGSSIAFNDYGLIIAAPKFKPATSGGKVYIFKNETQTPGWHVYRKPTGTVDISKIQKIQLYSNIDNTMLTPLDYIDPMQGKLLGAVRENLDYIGASDPAGYNNVMAKGNMVWGQAQVGKLWFDTSSSKFMNYHQDDVEYNSKHWGKVFPGSVVTVYSWIESDVNPANYVGAGTPYALDSFSIAYSTDSNDNLVTRFYFWVRNTNTLFSYQGKTLTDSVLERYIADPQQSGISYAAPLKQNIFGLYNTRQFINGTHTNIHIGFSDTEKDIANHAEFKLIRTDAPEDFLPGLPDAARGYTEPSGLYEKFISSFAGEDLQGNILPDPYLPKLQQIGISNKPRQSMFVNRFNALRNYLEYANSVLAKLPVAEFGNLTFLHAKSDYFDTSMYWDKTYWFADGYSATTKAAFEVPVYSDLLRLTPKENLIVGVTANGQGRREMHIYQNGAWTRIALEDGTIQFSSKLWDYQTYKTGFGDNFFDTVPFDSFPSNETRYIIRALNEQIFVGTLLEHRNKALILMFEYIQSEAVDSNNYMPWLNKTSFADVSYTVRQLTQSQKYQRDNEQLISGFVNEVKPYHVVIKDFFLQYTGLDTYSGSVTDFDLPAHYNSTKDRFETPVLVNTTPETGTKQYLASDAIWSDSDYTDWFNNYGLSLANNPNYEITKLAKYLSKNDTKIYVKSARGMPVIGTITIGTEIIGYANIDRDKGILTELTRGVVNTGVTDHLPNTPVIIDLPGAIVLHAGRNYIDPPEVKATIDTTIYPAPRREAVLKAVMAGDKVVGVNVIDAGDGYVAAPQITFTNSYEITFSEAQINFIDHTILVPTTEFNTGDLVHVTATGKAIPEGYYYVYVIATIGDSELISVSLHDNYSDSIKGDNKIIFPGIDNISESNTYTFGLSAHAVAATVNQKVRSIDTTLRFDRTSYQSRVTPWTPGEFWSSPYVSIGNDASSPESLFYTIPTDVVAADAKSVSLDDNGANAVLTINNMKFGGTYYADIKEAGDSYVVGDQLTFDGSDLGGESVTNDCAVTVTSTGFHYYMAPDHRSNVNGVGAKFYVDMLSTTVNGVVESTYTVTLDPYHTGSGYEVGDKLKIYGSNLQGVQGQDPDMYDAYLHNDIVITVDEVGSATGIGPITRIGYIGVPSGKGGIVSVDVAGKAFDPNLASLQGAVMPIKSVSSVAGTTNATVTVDLVQSGLKPGQIQGTPVYFYERPDTDNFYVYDDTTPDTHGNYGAYIKIYYPKFNPFSLSNQYFMQVGRKINDITGEYAANSFGNKYTDNYDPIIIDGALLGGVSGANDAVIRIRHADNGKIFSATISGVAPSKFDIYYVKPVSDDETEGTFQVYTEASLKTPVSFTKVNSKYPGSTAPYSHFMYVPEPLVSGLSYKYNTSSLVSFNGKVYKCINSNNSQVFNPSDWEELSHDDRMMNALDRIMGYYEPAANMPSKDLAQLVRGISYPHTVYYGNKFAPEDMLPVDYQLQAQTFYPRDINITGVAFDGTTYLASGDSNTHSVYMLSTDGVSWATKTLADKVLGTTGVVYTGKEFIISTMNTQTPLLLSFDTEHWITSGRTTLFDGLAWDIGGFDISPLSVPAEGLNGVSYLEGFYYSVGSGILRSMDGVIWEKVFDFNSSLKNHLNKIKFVSTAYTECYIAVGAGYEVTSGSGTAAPSFGNVSRIVTSLDGLNWFTQANISSAELFAVGASDNVIVVGGENGEIWYIQNGVNWSNASITTLDNTEFTETIRDITFAENVFVAVGDNGSILTSGDGMSWTQQASHTTRNLTTIHHDGSQFRAMGNGATIIRSFDGLVWADISSLVSPDANNVIKGSDFLYGYGPEELVAGVVSDALTMKVVTAPGSAWDDEELVQDKIYQNTGFNMVNKTVKPINNTVSFDGMVETPTQISVFIMDDALGLGTRIYEQTETVTPNGHNPVMYTVDWINKTITLTSSIDPESSVMVEVYEIGNGRQLIRTSTDYVPLVTNSVTGQTEIELLVEYNPISTFSCMFINGRLAKMPDDYFLTFSLEKHNYVKITFINNYDADTDYIVFALFDTSVNDLNPTEYTYSIPLTETFVGGQDSYQLQYSLQGSNTTNAIVEVNGFRLSEGMYAFDVATNTITLTNVTTSSDIVAVTTYNDTNRQLLQTQQVSTLSISPIQHIDSSGYPMVVSYAVDPGYTTGELVRFDNVVGSIGLNNKTYYLKKIADKVVGDITYYQYEIYPQFNAVDNVEYGYVDGVEVGLYVSGGFTWRDSDTFTIGQPFDLTVHPTLEVFVTDPESTWVTVNGMRVSTDKFALRDNNKLSIFLPSSYEDIIVTSMVNGHTPNQLTYALEIDRHGYASVYRQNMSDTSWLTQEINNVTTSIHVRNVKNLVDLTTQTHTVQSMNGELFVNIQAETSSIKEIYVSKITETGKVKITSPTSIEVINNHAAVVFTSGVKEFDTVEITIRRGDTIEVNAEKIRYAHVDLENNTISGLTRGVSGTSIVELHPVNSTVLSLVPSKRLDDKYYGVTWNSNKVDTPTIGDPLQISDTPAAKFLRYGNI